MNVLEESFRAECERCGINELLLVPSSPIITDSTVLDTDFWASLFCGVNPMGRRLSIILGDIVGTAETAMYSGSEGGVPSLSNVKAMYQLTFKKTFDFNDSEQFLTYKFFSELKAGGWGKYKIFARMCDMEDMVIPIGKAVLTKYIFTMPQSMEYQIQLEIVLSWKQNTYPTPIQIIGLDSALICEQLTISLKKINMIKNEIGKVSGIQEISKINPLKYIPLSILTTPIQAVMLGLKLAKKVIDLGR